MMPQPLRYLHGLLYRAADLQPALSHFISDLRRAAARIDFYFTSAALASAADARISHDSD